METAKKIIGVFLAVLMVLVSVPVSVFAAEGSSSRLHGNRTYRGKPLLGMRRSFNSSGSCSRFRTRLRRMDSSKRTHILCKRT